MSLSSDSGVSSVSASPPLSAPARSRRGKRRLCSSNSSPGFQDVYSLSGEQLGEGAYGRVEGCVNIFSGAEFAVKIVDKLGINYERAKVLKEIELHYLCQRQPSFVQMLEYFEENSAFYLVFEKARGGHLLSRIEQRIAQRRLQVDAGITADPLFEESEARVAIRQICEALAFLHSRGVAHRDLKPENILCMEQDALTPLKLADFDLCSSVQEGLSTPLLQSPVGSAEYMAPEVVAVFEEEEDSINAWNIEQVAKYDKKCDLWSLGVLLYLMLCGHLPFAAVVSCENCEWREGGECNACQRSLFNAISNEEPLFPDYISEEARDLLRKLLQKEPRARLNVEGVLDHQWMNIEENDCDDTGSLNSKDIETNSVNDTNAENSDKYEDIKKNNVKNSDIKKMNTKCKDKETSLGSTNKETSFNTGDFIESDQKESYQRMLPRGQLTALCGAV